MKDLNVDSDAIEWLGVRYKTMLAPAQTGGAYIDRGQLVASGQRPATACT